MIHQVKTYRLPIEYPFRRALSIYAKRLLTLSVVALQCWLILLASVAAIWLVLNHLLIATIAFGAVLSLGTLSVNVWLYRKFQGKRVTYVDDVENELDLPVLAAIPDLHTTKRHQAYAYKIVIFRRTILRIIKQYLKWRTWNVNYGPGAIQQVLYNDPRSPIGEAYRQLCTSLLLSYAGRPPKTILVTSSQPSAGGTTTALNTAIMLAQTGAKVLVIEANMRRPYFNPFSEKPGMSTILSSDMTEEDVLRIIDWDNFNWKNFNGIYFLYSGPIPPNPAALIGSERTRNLINLLSDRFTHIIIDSPPINSFTDAALLSQIVDGVMLVVHSGEAPLANVKRAKRVLQNAGANILGVVLNGCEYNYYN